MVYNDYNSESESKREKIYKLLKDLIDHKVPVTGVGIQGHWNLYSPSPEMIRKALDRYASLGLKIQITELDINIRGGGGANTQQSAVDSGLTPALAQKQADRYKELFEIFRSYKKVITGVTFWNVSDRYSWLDSRNGGVAGGAVAGEPASRVVRKAYPLLFDENLQRKPTYWDVVKF